MKTWEVYKMASENKNLKFRRASGGDLIYFFSDDGRPSYEGKRGVQFCSSDLLKLDEDWELVREPVDFMTAINSGKTIRSEFWGDGDFLLVHAYENNKPMRFTANEIKGKWCIMD